jgi:hypothetical protein
MLDPGDIHRAAFLWPTAQAIATSDATQYGPVVGTQVEKDKGPLLGLYVGGTGDVKVDLVGGGTVTFKAVPVGTILPVQVTKVYATGTTATFLVAGRGA